MTNWQPNRHCSIYKAHRCIWYLRHLNMRDELQTIGSMVTQARRSSRKVVKCLWNPPMVHDSCGQVSNVTGCTSAIFTMRRRCLLVFCKSRRRICRVMMLTRLCWLYGLPIPITPISATPGVWAMTSFTIDARSSYTSLLRNGLSSKATR